MSKKKQGKFLRFKKINTTSITINATKGIIDRENFWA